MTRLCSLLLAATFVAAACSATSNDVVTAPSPSGAAETSNTTVPTTTSAVSLPSPTPPPSLPLAELAFSFTVEQCVEWAEVASPDAFRSMLTDTQRAAAEPFLASIELNERLSTEWQEAQAANEAAGRENVVPDELAQLARKLFTQYTEPKYIAFLTALEATVREDCGRDSDAEAFQERLESALFLAVPPSPGYCEAMQALLEGDAGADQLRSVAPPKHQSALAGIDDDGIADDGIFQFSNELLGIYAFHACGGPAELLL